METRTRRSLAALLLAALLVPASASGITLGGTEVSSTHIGVTDGNSFYLGTDGDGRLWYDAATARASYAGAAWDFNGAALEETDPKGSYTVLVYKSGAQAIARKADGSLVAATGNDTAVVQAAVTAGAGGTVAFGAGTFTLNPYKSPTNWAEWKHAVKVADNVTLRATHATKITFLTGYNAPGATAGVTAFWIDAPGKVVTVEGFSYDGNAAGGTATYEVFVLANRFDLLRVRGNYLTNGHYGIYGDGSTAATSRLVIDGNYWKLTNSFAAASFHNQASRSHFTNNIVDGGSIGFFVDSVEDCLVSGNTFYKLATAAVWLYDSVYQCLIAGNTISGDAGSGTRIGVDIYTNAGAKPESDRNVVQGNTIIGQQKAVRLRGDGNVVRDNYLHNNAAAIDRQGDTNTVLRGNVGYATEAAGSATVANGGTSVVVTHGLAATPTSIRLGARHPEVSDAYVSAVGATTFTVTVAAAVTADRVLDWSANA